MRNPIKDMHQTQCYVFMMPVHVLVPPPRIRIPTRTHTKYSNVIQTLPHGSRCRQIPLHASAREVTRQRLGIRSSKYAVAHEGARPPEQNYTDADANQKCADTAVGTLRFETPARASALHRNIPICARSGFISRRSILAILEPHQSGMM